MHKRKEISIGELSDKLNGELIGDKGIIVNNIAELGSAKEGDIAFLFDKKISSLLDNTNASCVVVPSDVRKGRVAIIRCENPNIAFKKVCDILSLDSSPYQKGIHETAVIGKNVRLGKDLSIGAFTYIEDDSVIGDKTAIFPNCYIGRHSELGEECIIYPNVTIRENVRIGSRVIIHAGSTIGNDGFGYERTEGGHVKLPHIGGVVIEDDVEIGSCVTVDRAKISNTRIGRGTKIDNLVQIAHNVTIGQNCIIVAQCGISGSVKVGNNVIMGGQVGITDHVEIGDNVMVAAQAAIMKSVPPNSIMWGKPARPLKKAKLIYALFDKLPEIYERLKNIEKKLGVVR